MKPCEGMLPVQAGLLRPEPGLLLLSPGKDVSSSWHIPTPSPPVIFSGWGGGGNNFRIILPIMMLQKIEMLQWFRSQLSFLALPELFLRHRWTYRAAIPLCCDMLLAEGFKVFFIHLKCRLLPKKSNTFTVDCQQRWVSDVTDDLNLLISWEILLLENTERSMLFYQLYKLLTPRWTNLAV